MKITKAQDKFIKSLIIEIRKLNPNNEFCSYVEAELNNGLTIEKAAYFIDELKDIKYSELERESGDEFLYLTSSIQKMRESIIEFNDFLNPSRVENFILFSHISLNRVFIFLLSKNGENFKDSNNKTRDFTFLLNKMQGITLINNKQKIILLSLNQERNEIAHKIQRKSTDKSFIVDSYNLANQILDIFNEIIGKYNSDLKIKEKILNFETMYIDIGNVDIKTPNNIEKGKTVALLSKESSPIQDDEFRKGKFTLSNVVEILNSMLTNELLGDKFSTNYLLVFRQYIGVMTTTDSSPSINIKRDFDKIKVDDFFCYKDMLTKNIFYKQPFINEVKKVYLSFHKKGLTLKEIRKFLLNPI